MAHQTFFQRPDQLPYPFHVIIPFFNVWRWRVNWKHVQDMEKRVVESGAIPHIIEAAFGDRFFAVTEPGNPHHTQIRLTDNQDLWLKENLVNVAVQRLPPDWWAVGWLDKDVQFYRDDWANNTLHALQHWPVVQMFSQSLDTNADGELVSETRGTSFGWCYSKGLPVKVRMDTKDPYYGPAHPGLAWACRRSWWDATGGLLDWSILAGGSDWHMAYGMIGEIEWTLSPRHSPGYLRWMREWGRRATAATNGHLGVVPGLVLHDWHGPKIARGYNQREQLYVQHQFDPLTDLRRDWQGLWTLTDDKPALREAVARSLRERKEDHLE